MFVTSLRFDIRESRKDMAKSYMGRVGKKSILGVNFPLSLPNNNTSKYISEYIELKSLDY